MKIKIRTKKYKISKYYFFNIPLYQYIKFYYKNKKTIYSLIKKRKPKKNQRVFYLKVNRIHLTSFQCIRQWVNIAYHMNAFIYFVCDNKEMEKEIYKRIVFFNSDFDFIRSDRKTIQREISRCLSGVCLYNYWKRIAFALMTPYIHAKENNIKLSYNIDADDIIILQEPKIAAKAFKEAEEYASKNNLDLFNLDLFVSKTFGMHWSFGVVICTNPDKCIEVLKNNTNWRYNEELINKYNIKNINKNRANLDCFFTFLRDVKALNMGTFYIENALTVHMPDIILENGWGFMIQWHNNLLNFPVLKNFYNLEKLSAIVIPPPVIKIDAGIKINDYKKYAAKFFRRSYEAELENLKYSKEIGYISEDVCFDYTQMYEEETLKNNPNINKL